MGWNDHIDVTHIEQEICDEWFPDYTGDPFNHPEHEKIYEEALRRYLEGKVSAAEGREDSNGGTKRTALM